MKSDMIRTIPIAFVSAAVLLTTMMSANAAITFSFTESGGNVLMQSSGTFNTTNLPSVTIPTWAVIGTENNPGPDSDVMGDNLGVGGGSFDMAFGFNLGTDLSPWIGSMFTSSTAGWSSSGTTQFTTYYEGVGGTRTPGLAIHSEDMVGSVWTPDISWTKPGTFVDLGLTPGIYTITDFVTSESISIQIQNAVPEPASFAYFAFGAVSLLVHRRRKRHEVAARSLTD